MVLANRDQPAAPDIEDRIGVAAGVVWASHRPRRLASSQAPDPLVGVVGADKLAGAASWQKKSSPSPATTKAPPPYSCTRLRTSNGAGLRSMPLAPVHSS